MASKRIQFIADLIVLHVACVVSQGENPEAVLKSDHREKESKRMWENIRHFPKEDPALSNG